MLDQHPYHLFISMERGLVQRRGMRMAADRVVAIGILARVKQHARNLDVAVVRGNGERKMALGALSRGQQSPEIVDAPEGRADRKSHARAPFDKGPSRFHLAEYNRDLDRAAGIRAAIAQKINQRKLLAAFARHTAE